MQFPKRTEEHIKETASMTRLVQCLPNEWIVRHVTERDYGIDCLVELVFDGEVRGHLAAIQLKGIDSLQWTDGDSVDGDDQAKARYSKVKVETVNYWMALPVPVILCIHDEAADQIYFVDIKRQVRQRYAELSKQKTFGFDMERKLMLAPGFGIAVFIGLYFMERGIELFSGSLLDLLLHKDTYADCIKHGWCRDAPMEVDKSEVMMLIRLCKGCEVVLERLGGVDWGIKDVFELMAKDREFFSDAGAWMHELTRAKIVRKMAPRFVKAVKKGMDLVSVRERDYWLARDPMLVSYCDDVKRYGEFQTFEEEMARYLPSKQE